MKRSYNTKNRYKLNQEDISEIINLYNQGSTSTDIKEKMNIAESTVLRYLRKNNVNIRNKWNGSGNYNRVVFDYSYFKRIDNHNKAYVLGLLYADGNVATKSNMVTLNISKKDIELLDFVKEEIKYVGRYYKSTDDKYLKILFSSEETKKDLIKLGCVPNKSKILTFPNENQVPKEFVCSFVLGYFDGDGCIKKKGHISIAGTEMFCNKLLEISEDLNIEGHSKIHSNKSIYTFDIHKQNDAYNFLAWCYSNIIGLKRKYNRFIDLKNKIKSKL